MTDDKIFIQQNLLYPLTTKAAISPSQNLPETPTYFRGNLN